jgi:hypothetical protein
MFRFLLSVVALVALTAAVASPAKGNEAPAVTIIQDTQHNEVVQSEADAAFVELAEAAGMTSEAAYGVLHAEERIVKLPQDQNKFYLTVMGDKSDKKYQQLLEWLNTNPQLKSMKAQCHFNPIDTDKQIFTEHYAKTVPALPCIRMQEANGKTVFQASGNNIPMSAEALARGMSTECLFRWRRNNRNPAPNPEPAPNPDTDGDETDPDSDGASPDTVKPDVKPDESNHMMTVLAILAALGGGLALGGGHAFASNLEQYRANHR